MAGAVFRPTGSPTTIAPGHSRRQASTRSRAVITTTRLAAIERVARANVAASSDRPPVASGSSCLGRAAVLHGQNRSPRPPARMSAPRSAWAGVIERLGVAQVRGGRHARSPRLPGDVLVEAGGGLGDVVPRVVLRDVGAGAGAVALDLLRVLDQVVELRAQVLHVLRAEAQRALLGHLHV